MPSPFPNSAPIRLESHFVDRVMPCYADRPPDTWALFERALAAQGESDALVDATQRLSWRELATHADEVAAGFARAGVRPGDRVGLLAGNRTAFVTTLAGLLRLGAIAVPMGTRLQTPEIAYILAHCGAVGLVHDEDLTARLPDAADVPALRHRWVDPPREAARAARDLLPPRPPVTEEDTVFILYTSGTTGRPKGAMLTHLNIVHSALHYAKPACLRVANARLLAVPASHVTGLVAIIAAMWRVAAAWCWCPSSRPMPSSLLAARTRDAHGDGAGDVQPVPDATGLRHGQADLSAWRIGGYGGAPMPVSTIDELAARLPGLMPLNCLRRHRDHLAGHADARRLHGASARQRWARRCRAPTCA
jgi:long-chain acyl-CoA synthetase